MALGRFLDELTKVKTKVETKVKAKVEPPRMQMNLCMLGARGVGKTSVITSMYNSQKEAVSGSNLFLAADTGTSMMLNDKKIQLEYIFSGYHEEGSYMTESGIAGDSSETMFKFTYGLNSEKINIDLEIRDYPGEYLKKEPEIVAKYIEEANAVMIAIDTPCLMEADAKYNAGKNHPELVTNFLMNHLKKGEEKLILFVPLKCEKYFHNGTIDQVTKKVEEVYADLIMFLRDREDVNGFKKKICCAITPIQTLGEVEFDSFGQEDFTDREGNVLPKKTNYKYISSNAKYRPQYCDQPLYYLLAFVTKQYQKVQDEEKVSGWFGKLKEMLKLIPNVDEFLCEISSLGQKRLEDTEGYKILFGRGRV